MKLVWHDEKHELVDLIAETLGEVAFSEVIASELNAHRYKTIKRGNRVIGGTYSIRPEEKLVK